MQKRIMVIAMMFQDGAFLTKREIFLKSKQKNGSATTTKTKLLFIADLQRVVKYSKAIEEEYGVKFV